MSNKAEDIAKIEKLLRTPHNSKVFLWVIPAKHRDTGEIKTTYITNMPSYITSKYDTILPNKSFLSRLEGDVIIGLNSGKGDKFAGMEGITSGEISIDFRDISSKLQHFLSDEYTFEDLYVDLYFGTDNLTDLSEFLHLFHCKVLNISENEGTIKLVLDDWSAFLSKPCNDQFFKSLGGGIKFGTNIYGVAFHRDNLDITDTSFMIGCYFKLNTTYSGTNPVPILTKGYGPTCNYGLYVGANRKIFVRSGADFFATASNVFELNKIYSVIFVKDKTVGKIFIDGELLKLSETFSETSPTNTDSIFVNLSSSNETADITIYETIVYSGVFNDEDVANFSEGPFTKSDLDINSALRVVHYKFEDYQNFTGENPFVDDETGTYNDLLIKRKDVAYVKNQSFEFEQDDTISSGTISQGNSISFWTTDNSTKAGRCRLDEGPFDNGYTSFGRTVAFIKGCSLFQDVYLYTGITYKIDVKVNAGATIATDPQFRLRIDGSGILAPTTVSNVGSVGVYTSAFTTVSSNTFTVATTGFHQLEIIEITDSNYLLIDNVKLYQVPAASSPSFTYVSSFEGDDPEVNTSGMLGKVKPLAFGEPKNIQNIWLDSNLVYGGPGCEYSRVYRGRINGIPMVPLIDKTYSDGPTTFRSWNKSIKFPYSTNLDLLIESQLSPILDGQQISIGGTSSNDNTFTISTVDMNTSTVYVKEAVVDEEAVFGVSLQSVDYDFVDNGTYVDLSPIIGTTGDITWDIEKSIGISKVSNVIETLLYGYDPTIILDTSTITFNPYVSLYTNDKDKRDKVFSTLLMSSFSFLHRSLEDPTKVVMKHYPLITPEPSYIIRESVLDDLYISEKTSVNPNWKLIVTYNKNHFKQDEGRLSSNVSIENRRRYSKEYETHVISDRNVLRRYPDSEEITIDTYLSNRGDAITLANNLFKVFSKKLRFYEIGIRNFGAILIPGTSIRVFSGSFISPGYKDLIIKTAHLSLMTDSWKVLAYEIGK